jgi:hypothetical protein
MEPLSNHDPAHCCWNCDHFQRFDPDPKPKLCEGQCRAKPLNGAMFQACFVSDRSDGFGHNKECLPAWPWIPCGLRGRCSSFALSTEKDLPQSPMSFGCTHNPPTPYQDWRAWAKPGKGICLTCHWFEPEECPYRGSAPRARGSCLYYPPAQTWATMFEIQIPMLEIGVNPTIENAHVMWCSCWEGPRPIVDMDPTPIEAPKNELEAYQNWEVGRPKAVWLTSLLFSRISRIREYFESSKPQKCGKVPSKKITPLRQV